MAIEFEWDPAKAARNLRRHDVDLPEAATVFADPRSITVADPDHSLDAERPIILGSSARGRVLVVMFSERSGRVRIISARLAIRRERAAYEEEGFELPLQYGPHVTGDDSQTLIRCTLSERTKSAGDRLTSVSSNWHDAIERVTRIAPRHHVLATTPLRHRRTLKIHEQ